MPAALIGFVGVLVGVILSAQASGISTWRRDQAEQVRELARTALELEKSTVRLAHVIETHEEPSAEVDDLRWETRCFASIC